MNDTFEFTRARTALRDARRVLAGVEREIRDAERLNLRTRPRDIPKSTPPVVSGALIVKREHAQADVLHWEKVIAFQEDLQRGQSGGSTISAGTGPGRTVAAQHWGPGPYPVHAYPGERRRDTWDEDDGGDVPSRPSWWPR